MAKSLVCGCLGALLLLVYPVHTFASRMRPHPEAAYAVQSLAQMAAEASVTDSNLSLIELANVDISDIHRYGYLNWYVVKDGSAVLDNLSGKYVSAKPRNIIWDRIGSWNYTRSSRKTKPLIKVKLDGTTGALVKMDLALRFQFGGRVKKWTGHPKLRGKGRFLRNVRVVPLTHFSKVHGGYTGSARVTEVKVRRIGKKSNPVSEARLTIKIKHGKKSHSMAHWYQGIFQVTVQGTGRYTAQKLISNKPDAFGMCTQKDKSIMIKMGKGYKTGTWPNFLTMCSANSVSGRSVRSVKWTGHNGITKCIKTKKISKGCATCWGDYSRFLLDHCRKECVQTPSDPSKWCKLPCISCGRRYAKGINPIRNLMQCTGMGIPQLLAVSTTQCPVA